MSKAKKPTCEEQVRHGKGYFIRRIPCGKGASIVEGGKHYCKMHAPSLVKARRDKRTKEYTDRWDSERAASNLRTHKIQCYDALLAACKLALECGACGACEIAIRKAIQQAEAGT